MKYTFRFPDIGEGISEGKIVEWYVKVGQAVKSGEPLVKMETDKVVTDIPSPKDGVIIKLFGKEDDVIDVEAPLVELEIEGAAGAEPIAVEEEGAGVVGVLEIARSTGVMAAGTEGRTASPAEGDKPAKKALATPVARAIAKELGVDINQIPGTGPGGRVMKKDIQAFAGNPTAAVSSVAGPAAPPLPAIPLPGIPVNYAQGERVVYEPLTQIRKTIARNMSRSKQSAAHMSVMEEVEISELVKLRASYKEEYAQRGLKLSYLSFVLKAVAFCLKEFPPLRSEMDLESDRMIVKNYYNIGMAVDTDNGLVVPVIRDVDKLTIAQLAHEVSETARKARERQLTMNDFKDGTFTITSIGSIAGTYAVPVLNYPETGILAVGRVIKTPVVKNDQIVIGHVLPLSLSVDHRVVDGGDAVRFLAKLAGFLQDPVSLLLV